jgi:hypothetical protein
MRGVCLLCKKERELQLSHIIPNFVYNWLKDTSPSYIRSSQNPNQRVQDGPKHYLLCAECEGLFSKWEAAFAENIFHPLHESGGKQLYWPYEEWCLKFAVSITWRVLAYGNIQGISHFSEKQNRAMKKALETWNDFLLGKCPDPGEFEQHIVLTDLIRNHTVPDLSAYINRYMVRSIDVDIPCTDRRAYVYAKMGRVILLGFIQEPWSHQWQGTKIHVKKGSLGSKRYILPRFIGSYINLRANKAASSLASLSDKQRQKITNTLKDKTKELAESEIIKAMNQDVNLFGDEAFDITRRKI